MNLSLTQTSTERIFSESHVRQKQQATRIFTSRSSQRDHLKNRKAYFTCYLIIWLRVKFQRTSNNHFSPRSTPLDTNFRSISFLDVFLRISQTCCCQWRHILRLHQLCVFKIMYCIIIRSTITTFWLPTTEVTLAYIFYCRKKIVQ